MTYRFLPKQGWPPDCSGDSIVFDPALEVPEEAHLAMTSIADLADTEDLRAFRAVVLDTPSWVVPALRLMARFSEDTGVRLDGVKPNSLAADLLPEDPAHSHLEVLFDVLRVMVSREVTLNMLMQNQGNSTDLDDLARDFGGVVLADEATALILKRGLGAERARELYRSLGDAFFYREQPRAQLMRMVNAQGLTLTEPQQKAADAMLANWRTVRQRCLKPVVMSEWPSSYRDERWRDLDHAELWPRVMVLAGPAGVGKSFALAAIVLQLMQQDDSLRRVCLTASTHSACRVLAHYFSALFTRLTEVQPELNINSIMIEERGRPLMAWQLMINGRDRYITHPRTLFSAYAPRAIEDMDSLHRSVGQDSTWDLGVNDESSMLMRPLLRGLSINCRHPMLLTGDPGQMPPVAEETSDNPFTDLVQAGYEGLIGAYGDLMHAPNLRTDPERSGILRLANAVRRHINLPPTGAAEEALDVKNRALATLQDTIESIAADGQGVRLVPPSSAIRSYVTDFRMAMDDMPQSVVITGTHDSRNKLNRDIRKQLGFREILEPGEILIVESYRAFRPTPTTVLTNNQIVRVLEVDLPTEVEIRFPAVEGLTLAPMQLTCVPCVVDVEGEAVPIVVPQLALEFSPKSDKQWRQVYRRAFAILKEAAAQALTKLYGSSMRASTYAVLSLFSDDHLLRIPNGKGGWLEWPWSKLGLGSFVFPPEHQLHYFHGNFMAFAPRHLYRNSFESISSNYSIRDLAIAQRMLRLSTEPVVFAHYGYAITGHASQGSQFENVYAKLDPPSLWQYTEASDGEARRVLQDVLRWVYVVATRAQRSLQLMEVPFKRRERQPAPMSEALAADVCAVDLSIEL